jgi:hypothetical protein
MKQLISSTIQKITSDRPLSLLMIGVILGGLAYILYVALSLSSSDLQLAVRYTSFGETHFYRDQWWYLFSFIGFGILFLIAHIGMTAKLVAIDLKQLAYAFALLSVVILIIMFAYTYSVLGIAYLN